MKYIKTDENRADMFTKPLDRATFEYHAGDGLVNLKKEEEGEAGSSREVVSGGGVALRVTHSVYRGQRVVCTG